MSKSPQHTNKTPSANNSGVVKDQNKVMEKHKIIIDQYFNHFNKSKAVLDNMDVTSQANAVHIFNSIAAKPANQRYIKQLQSDLRRSTHIDNYQQLNEFLSHATSDITVMLGDEEEEQRLKELPANIRRTIQSFKLTTREEVDRKGNLIKTKTMDLKLTNKLDALKEATKMTGGYMLDNQQKNNTLDLSTLPIEKQLEALQIAERLKNMLSNEG